MNILTLIGTILRLTAFGRAFNHYSLPRRYVLPFIPRTSGSGSTISCEHVGKVRIWQFMQLYLDAVVATVQREGPGRLEANATKYASNTRRRTRSSGQSSTLSKVEH